MARHQHACMHAYMHTWFAGSEYTGTRQQHACIHASCIHTYLHGLQALNTEEPDWGKTADTCIHACMHTHTHTYGLQALDTEEPEWGKTANSVPDKNVLGDDYVFPKGR